MVALTNSLGYKKGSQSKGIPKATNVTLNSHTISELLWSRIEKFVPEEFNGRRVLGLDEKIRFLKYDPIDKECGISKHTAINWLAIGKHPLSAICILSDDYEGCQVLFPDTSNVSPPTHLAELGAGHVVILEDSVLTQAMPITKGAKYIMRMDIRVDEDEDDDMLMAEQDTIVDTMHQFSLSELNSMDLSMFSPRLPTNMPTLPTVTDDLDDLPQYPLTQLQNSDSPHGGSRSDVRSNSLPRSDCSHDPLDGIAEMKRGSFTQNMETPRGENLPNPGDSNEMQRQFSGRVAMDAPALAVYPSLRSMTEKDVKAGRVSLADRQGWKGRHGAQARHSTPSMKSLLGKRRMLPVSRSNMGLSLLGSL